MADFLITNHGSITTFWPLTESAKEHCEEMFPDDCQMFGRSYVAEHRYAPDIIADLRDRGFDLGESE